MDPSFNLTGITLIAALALLFGLVLTRLRQPAIVGYLLAGLVLGPSGFGLVPNTIGTRTFAELGLLALLFLTGLSVSLRALRPLALTLFAAALLQVAIALAIASALVPLAGWPLSDALVFGFALALPSTVVGMTLLENVGELRSDVGRLGLGVLAVLDLLVLPMLITVRSLGLGGAVDLWLVVKILAALAALLALAHVLSRTTSFASLPFTARLRRPDLAPLAVMTFCLALAALLGLLGLSPAYGAFIAGLVLGATRERRHILRLSRPAQSLVAMIVFVSLGLMVEVGVLWRNLPLILLLIAVTVVTKILVGTLVLRLFGVRLEQAFPAAVATGQLGEFSFLIGAAAMGSGAITPEHFGVVLVVIVASLLLSPFWLMTLHRLARMGAPAHARVGALIEDVYGGEIASLRALASSAYARARRFGEGLGRRRRPPPSPPSPPPGPKRDSDLTPF